MIFVIEDFEIYSIMRSIYQNHLHSFISNLSTMNYVCIEGHFHYKLSKNREGFFNITTSYYFHLTHQTKKHCEFKQVLCSVCLNKLTQQRRITCLLHITPENREGTLGSSTYHQHVHHL
jgi:hypothetical protein